MSDDLHQRIVNVFLRHMPEKELAYATRMADTAIRVMQSEPGYWRERAEKAEAAIARVRHLVGTYRVNAESADDAKARNWFELFAEELQGALEPPHELLIEEETGRHVEP